MSVILAMYRGPDRSNLTMQKALVHVGICLWTLSRHSHGELFIDGTCYSSSAMDKGVRSKTIDIYSGRWDLYPLHGADKAKALAWFEKHKGKHYDWPGILSWVIRLVRHHPDRFVCFEAIGEMLGIEKPHRLSARKLIKWARSLSKTAAGVSA